MSSTDNFRSHCFLCEESSFKDLFGKDHFLRKCKNCGMVSSYIIPSEIELKEFYDEYPSYEKLSPLTEQRYNEILDKLEPFRKTNNLFESGCGFGFFLEEAKKRKWNVYGSELSEQAIIACERKGLPVFQDMQKITGIANGPFDAIISLEVIEHLTDPGLDVESYSQFLRPGGAVYITTPNFNSFSRYRL